MTLIAIDESGKIILTDERLIELEATHMMAGNDGPPPLVKNPSCGGQTNPNCDNFRCAGSSNTTCHNDICHSDDEIT